MLVIADAERAVAIGGVMGGANSEIGASTKRMVLESAYFQPASVRRTSKRLNLKTEASTRFERGGDINAPVDALARAAALLEQIGAAQSGTIGRRLPCAAKADSRSRCARRGSSACSGWSCRTPTCRAFCSRLASPSRAATTRAGRSPCPASAWTSLREIDLVEEVGRHYGFDRLPSTFPLLAAPQPRPGSAHRARPEDPPGADGSRVCPNR